MYIVYVIGRKKDIYFPYEKCYVGVTKNKKDRWTKHTQSNYTVGKYIRDHQLKFDCMKTIFMGTEKECFEKEITLRPNPYMGLNEASGGCGGYTAYEKERNLKISKSMSGRKLSEEHIKKLKTIFSDGRRVGSKNGNSKKWILISPEGEEHIIYGSIQQKCDELGLLRSSLGYYKNRPVPKPKTTGLGGFRKKNIISERKRLMTTGWTLQEYVSKETGGVL